MVQSPKNKLLLPPDPLLDQNFLLFLQSLFTLFAIFDPIGNLPILFSLTSDMGEAERKKLVRRSSLVSYGILLTFGFLGELLFILLGITIADFKVIGGIILLIFSVEYVLGRGSFRVHERGPNEDIAVFPLATPLLAGPGSISFVVLMPGFLTKFVVVTLIVAISWFILHFGTGLLKFFGPQGSTVVSRIMGLLIGAVAIRFIREGLIEILRMV